MTPRKRRTFRTRATSAAAVVTVLWLGAAAVAYRPPDATRERGERGSAPGAPGGTGKSGLEARSTGAATQDQPMRVPRGPTRARPERTGPPTARAQTPAQTPAQTSARPQAWGLNAVARSGQVFITWREADGSATYRVYRSPTPISVASLANAELVAEVGSESSRNHRKSGLLSANVNYAISDLAAPLGDDEGLFVRTITTDAIAYYAVTAVADGRENRELAPGQNVLTAPVSERVGVPRPVLQERHGSVFEYVHWAPDVAVAGAPVMAHRAGMAFNLRVHYQASYGPVPRPVMLKLHGGAGSYRLPAEAGRPEAIVVCPDDDLGEAPFRDHWFGVRDGLGGDPPSVGDLVRDFTARRVLAELDFAAAAFNGDPDRVYVRGQSMGAVGAVFLGYRFPERFAAIHAVLPKFDFSCQADGCWSMPAATDAIWGRPSLGLRLEDGTPVYDALRAAALLKRKAGAEMPVLFAASGRGDTTVGWSEKPAMYAAAQAARQPAVFYWDDGGHSIGAWGSAMNERQDELWSIRRNAPVPAFANLSADDQPGDGAREDGSPEGSINGRLAWDAATVVDTAREHSVRVKLRPGLNGAPTPPSATVDWTPRRLREFERVPGERYRFINLQLPGGNVIEERPVAADSGGLITVPRATVTAAGNVLRLVRACPADLNHDGRVDAIDAALFQQALADGSQRADLNGDGAADAADGAAFQRALAEGCGAR